MYNPELITRKIERIKSRGYMRTVDLFAGCGGMSLGFDRAGFRSVAAVEVNEEARLSHAHNFGDAKNSDYRSFDDIRATTPAETVQHLCKSDGLPVEEVVDLVIGGPPCQAFSRLGRAALWRLAEKDHAHAEDERASYYVDYLKYVEQLQPIAFVMENVREIGKFAGRNIAEEIAITADDMGYNVKYALLNAVWYGVPQLRERMFIIGIKRDLSLEPAFPRIRFSYDLPTGYSTSRAGDAGREVLEPKDHFFDHADEEAKLFDAISAKEAFEDLPKITHHLDGRGGKGFKRDVNQVYQYASKGGRYAREMREWPSFLSGNEFTGHVIRYTPRDYETFRRMPHGGMYPEALETAEQIFAERLRFIEREIGYSLDHESEEFLNLKASIVPPYPVNRYPNKFRKMWPEHPARTVPAHIGKDGYSHIHFDSEQARCISLREAARLQSFPDGFKLEGSMNKQLTQIGNAVPPLLAFAVASQLADTLSQVFPLPKVSASFERSKEIAAE